MRKSVEWAFVVAISSVLGAGTFFTSMHYRDKPARLAEAIAEEIRPTLPQEANSQVTLVSVANSGPVVELYVKIEGQEGSVTPEQIEAEKRRLTTVLCLEETQLPNLKSGVKFRYIFYSETEATAFTVDLQEDDCATNG